MPQCQKSQHRLNSFLIHVVSPILSPLRLLLLALLAGGTSGSLSLPRLSSFDFALLDLFLLFPLLAFGLC